MGIYMYIYFNVAFQRDTWHPKYTYMFIAVTIWGMITTRFFITFQNMQFIKKKTNNWTTKKLEDVSTSWHCLIVAKMWPGKRRLCPLSQKQLGVTAFLLFHIMSLMKEDLGTHSNYFSIFIHGLVIPYLKLTSEKDYQWKGLSEHHHDSLLAKEAVFHEWLSQH